MLTNEMSYREAGVKMEETKLSNDTKGLTGEGSTLERRRMRTKKNS